MARVSNKPWGSISESDYGSPAAFCDACLINENTGVRSDWAKSRCKLPVREPGGAINRGGVHAAAAALAGARGGVSASPAAKRAAARKLRSLYAQINEEAPDSLRRMGTG